MCRLSQVPKANLSNNDDLERLHPIGPSDTPPRPSVCQWALLASDWEPLCPTKCPNGLPQTDRTSCTILPCLPTLLLGCVGVRRNNNMGRRRQNAFHDLHNSVARPHRLVANFQDATIGLFEPPSHVVWATLQHRETKLEQFLQVRFHWQWHLPTRQQRHLNAQLWRPL